MGILRSKLGTVVVGVAMLAGSGLLLWNMFGQGPYGDACRFSIGCRSFSCLHHELDGIAQVPASGRCTKACDADAECGPGAACVVLSEAARDDLPPLGKPDKACMRIRPSPIDVPR